MNSEMDAERPHVICVPLPAQGHINPMLKLAKLFHHIGFFITFVHTKFNFDRLIKSNGPNSLKGLPDFRFETISDGLPPENERGIMDLPDLCKAIPIDGLISFRDIITKIVSLTDSDVPPVTCIISDGVMSFTLKVAQEFNIPEFMLFTPSGCGMLGYLNFEELQKRGYFPLKGTIYLIFDFFYQGHIFKLFIKGLNKFVFLLKFQKFCYIYQGRICHLNF